MLLHQLCSVLFLFSPELASVPAVERLMGGRSGWLLEALGPVMGRESLMGMRGVRVGLLKSRRGTRKSNPSAPWNGKIPRRGRTAPLLLAGLLLLLLGHGGHGVVDRQIRGGELVGGRVRAAGIRAHHRDEGVGGWRKLMAARLLIGGRGHRSGCRHLVVHVGGAGGRRGRQQRAWVGDRCGEAVSRRRADGWREPGRIWRQLVGHRPVVRGVQFWNWLKKIDMELDRVEQRRRRRI